MQQKEAMWESKQQTCINGSREVERRTQEIRKKLRYFFTTGMGQDCQLIIILVLVI